MDVRTEGVFFNSRICLDICFRERKCKESVESVERESLERERDGWMFLNSNFNGLNLIMRYDSITTTLSISTTLSIYG